jgi:hypothetical protein
MRSTAVLQPMAPCLCTAADTVVLQALDTFLAMSSMFGYTATLVLIPTLAMIAYLLPWKLPAWGIGLFITGATVAGCTACTTCATMQIVLA